MLVEELTVCYLLLREAAREASPMCVHMLFDGRGHLLLEHNIAHVHVDLTFHDSE